MAQLPFSVFKRKGRRFYYVQFKNKNGDYLPAVSTRQTLEPDAIEMAFKWLREGKPPKHGNKKDAEGTVCIDIRDAFRKISNLAEAEFICRELKRQGFLKSYIIADSKQAVDFGEFLENFWDYETSPYIKEKLRKNHGIHRNYTKGQKLAVQKFWKPFFCGRFIGDITREDLENFMNNLDSLANKNRASLKRQLQNEQNGQNGQPERVLSAGRKNIVIKAGTIPLRWAFAKEIIEKDITNGITWFSGRAKETQLLTPEIVQAAFNVPWRDGRSLLANMLAAVTGLRAGEIQGLQLQDLGKECVYIRHSWNFRDGLKTPKTNEPRTVEVPFPVLIQNLLSLAERNPHGVGANSYVFWADKSPSKPMEAHLFLKGLREALVKIGMSEESASIYIFHGWRHFFTSYMKNRLKNNKLVRSQTGHKTDAMLTRYSEHILSGEREEIRQAQQDLFGELIPVGKSKAY